MWQYAAKPAQGRCSDQFPEVQPNFAVLPCRHFPPIRHGFRNIFVVLLQINRTGCNSMLDWQNLPAENSRI